MKFKTYGMILSLFLALGLVFSFGVEAYGSNGDSTGTTAEEVAADPGNEEKMQSFVERIANRYNEIRAPLIGNLEENRAALIRQLTIFARDLRRDSADGGIYKHGDIYQIGINDDGIVTNHAGHHGLIGYRINLDASDSAVAETLKVLLNPDIEADDPAVCQRYEDNQRVACASKVVSDFTSDVTNIVGLRHEAGDSAFDEPDCSGLELGTTAKNVYDDPTDDNLKAYVKGVIDAVQEDIARISLEEARKLIAQDQSLSQDLARLAELSEAPITTRVQQRLFCFGSEDKGFKHKNIYVFMMDADPAHSTVLFNGNNFDLNGGNLALEDEELDHEDKTIAGLFSRALAGGTSAYANYRWDDPTTDADNIRNWFEINSVPGSSPKRSYIEVADLYAKTPGAPEQHYIFGSGIYLKEDSGGDNDDDGGCAVAGAGSTSQGTLLNLLLTASVLFSVAFLRKRA